MDIDVMPTKAMRKGLTIAKPAQITQFPLRHIPKLSLQVPDSLDIRAGREETAFSRENRENSIGMFIQGTQSGDDIWDEVAAERV
jgi:hypothetical protein